MPTAAGKLEKQGSCEACDPVKQVLTIVEKKVRNLEKRKTKLEAYKHDCAIGKDLNVDQKKAVEKYDQVVEVLEFAKELQKQFHNVIQENAKAQKKAARREKIEKQQYELERIKEILLYLDLLNNMGNDDVRQDFLNGTNGAVKLNEGELNNLDELYKAVCPERDNESETNSDFDRMLSSASDHMQSILDCKNKEAFGTTYKALNETLQKINSSSYFKKNNVEPEVPVESVTSANLEPGIEALKVDDNEELDKQPDPLLSPAEAVVGLQDTSASKIDRPYFEDDSVSFFCEQNKPIQEVLAAQSSLNFLQESQIHVQSPRIDQPVATQAAVAFAGVPYSTSQPIKTPSNSPQKPNEEASTISNHPSPSSVLLANSSLPQVRQGICTPGVLLTSQPADFDPTRPIPTQTYTNQSLTPAIHPMMASTVSQNYVVPVTLPHSLPPSVILQAGMVVPPVQRGAMIPQCTAPNTNTLSMTSVRNHASGLEATRTFSQVKKHSMTQASGGVPSPSASNFGSDLRENARHAGAARVNTNPRNPRPAYKH